MRRFAVPGLVMAVALGLFAARAEAWSGGAKFGSPFAGPQMGAGAWSGSARYGSPFAGSPVGELQNEAWGRYLMNQHFRNNPPPPPQVYPQFPNWAWMAPSWQWNGFQWVWVPGYWVPRK